MSFWSRISAIDHGLDEASYYSLLGVETSSSADEIRERYYKLATKLHPDRYVARSTKEGLASLNRIHARMGEASKVLLDADQREAYDRGLAEGRMRLDDTTAKPRKLSNRDPSTPMARTLYEKAIGEIAAGSTKKAKANLILAKQYEPASRAIAEALADIDPPKEPEAKVAPSLPSPSLPSPVLETPAKAAPPSAERVPAAVPPNRGHDRHSTALPVRLRIPDWERFKVLYTRDISRGGMFLKSTKSLPIGSLLNLNLMMPTGETIELGAEVVHFRPAASGRPSGMGLRFGTVSPETRKQLDALMESKPKPKPQALSLEELVSELVRIRDLPAHELLEIPADASRDDARVAYETLARLFHPHRNNAGNDPVLFDICRELIGCVRLAYETISKK
ncbi:MAG: DnaJ domain-containing protein [Myxococcales bacterium]|nr:DnaJ domain-containing protein [Myxococcales bacterium]